MILCAKKSKHRHAYTYIQRTIDIIKISAPRPTREKT